MIEQEILDDAREKMAKAIEHLLDDFSRVRTGRATSGLVEKLRVDVYGSEMPLQQIAGFSVPEPRLLVISPYDKSTINAIEKAIRHSNLGINPGNDGVVIRLVFPPLTEERRKEFVKVVKHKAEDARVSVRNVRRHARGDLEDFEKEGEISEDALARAEKDLDKLTHEHVEIIDAKLAHKESELLEV